MINREDMLELTRRMTSARTHLVRLAGAYMDDEGYLDGNFNVHFLKLSGSEKAKCINIAKTIPYAPTNTNLKEYRLPAGAMKSGSIWQLLYALMDCELKNDALLMNFYEMLGEQLPTGHTYAIYIYLGVYDVPVKAADKERVGESEEVYTYLLGAVCPTDDEQNVGQPTCGFLWPAFKNRSSDLSYVNIFQADEHAPIQAWNHVFGF